MDLLEKRLSGLRTFFIDNLRGEEAINFFSGDDNVIDLTQVEEMVNSTQNEDPPHSRSVCSVSYNPPFSILVCVTPYTTHIS